MKTLIIVVHPNLTESVINKKWLDELRKYREKYTVHQLHKSYPDGNIDVLAEQRLGEEHIKMFPNFLITGLTIPPC